MQRVLLLLLISPLLASASIRGRTRRSDIASLEARVALLETQGSCSPEVRIHVDVEGGSFEEHEDHGQDVDHSHEQHGHTHDTHADHGEHHDASHEDTSRTPDTIMIRVTMKLVTVWMYIFIYILIDLEAWQDMVTESMADMGLVVIVTHMRTPAVRL